MDRIFFDTNVLMDALAIRDPFFDQAVAVMAVVERGEAAGSFGALSMATIDYLLKTNRPKDKQRKFQMLRGFMDVAPLGGEEVDRALRRSLSDFEDGLQWESAKSWGATHLVTRNVKDFPVTRSLRVLTPTDYLHEIGA